MIGSLDRIGIEQGDVTLELVLFISAIVLPFGALTFWLMRELLEWFWIMEQIISGPFL